MEDEMDDTLRCVYDRLVLSLAPGEGTSKRLIGDEIYYANRHAIFKGAPINEETSFVAGKTYKYAEDIKHIPINIPDNLRPEIALYRDVVKLTEEDKILLQPNIYTLPVTKDVDTYPAGYWLMEKQEDEPGAFKLLRVIPFGPRNKDLLNSRMVLTHVSSTDAAAIGNNWMGLRPALMLSKTIGATALTLYGETSMCYIVLNQLGTVESFSTVETEDGTVYAADGWKDDVKSWKRLIKKQGERKMKMANPLKLEAAKLVQQADKRDPEVAEAVQQIPNLATAGVQEPAAPKKAAVKSIMDVEVTEETPAVQPVTEEQTVTEEVQPAAEPEVEARRQRKPRPAAKALKIDFAKLIEDLSTPPEPVTAGTYDAAKAECLSLRDLQIALARREANLISEMFKYSKDAIERWEAIRKVLK